MLNKDRKKIIIISGIIAVVTIAGVITAVITGFGQTVEKQLDISLDDIETVVVSEDVWANEDYPYISKVVTDSEDIAAIYNKIAKFRIFGIAISTVLGGDNLDVYFVTNDGSVYLVAFHEGALTETNITFNIGGVETTWEGATTYRANSGSDIFDEIREIVADYELVEEPDYISS